MTRSHPLYKHKLEQRSVLCVEKFNYADFTRHRRLSEPGNKAEGIEEKKEKVDIKATGKDNSFGRVHGP